MMRKYIKYGFILLGATIICVGPFSIAKSMSVCNHYMNEVKQCSKLEKELVHVKQECNKNIKQDVSNRNGIINPIDFSAVENFMKSQPTFKITQKDYVCFDKSEVTFVSKKENANGLYYKLACSNVDEVLQQLSNAKLYYTEVNMDSENNILSLVLTLKEVK